MERGPFQASMLKENNSGQDGLPEGGRAQGEMLQTAGGVLQATHGSSLHLPAAEVLAGRSLQDLLLGRWCLPSPPSLASAFHQDLLLGQGPRIVWPPCPDTPACPGRPPKPLFLPCNTGSQAARQMGSQAGGQEAPTGSQAETSKQNQWSVQRVAKNESSSGGSKGIPIWDQIVQHVEQVRVPLAAALLQLHGETCDEQGI